MLKNHCDKKLMRTLTTSFEHFMSTRTHTEVTHDDEKDKQGAWPYRFKKYIDHWARATAITLSNCHIMANIWPLKRTVVSELQRLLRSSVNSAQLQHKAMCYPAHSARIYYFEPRFRSIHKLLNWPRYSSEVISQTPLYFSILQKCYLRRHVFGLHDRQRPNYWDCHVVKPHVEVVEAK